MARIVQFDEIATGNDKVHGPVACGYKIFAGPTSTILQLDTVRLLRASDFRKAKPIDPARYGGSSATHGTP